MLVGIHERLLCAKFGVLKLVGSWVMSTSSFAYNSLDRGVSRRLMFFSPYVSLTSSLKLDFWQAFWHQWRDSLCKIWAFKTHFFGRYKDFEFFQQGLVWSLTWFYVIPSYLTLTTYSNVQIWHRTASYGCRDVCKIWFQETVSFENY